MAGHGHVTPNPDGSKVRCGGPRLCPQCAGELAAKQPPTPSPAKASVTVDVDFWPIPPRFDITVTGMPGMSDDGGTWERRE